MGHYVGIGAVIIILVSLFDFLRWIHRELTKEPDPQQEIPFGKFEGDSPPRLPPPKPAKPKPEQQKLSYSQWLQQQRENIKEIPRERYPGQEDDVEEVNITEAELLRQARSLASQMADEANMELDSVQWLYREIIKRGGLKRYNNGHEQEEYEVNVPRWYRRKADLPADEMAAELGYDTDSDLYDDIAAAERARKEMVGKLPKNVKKFRAKDFLEDAKWELRENVYCIGVVEEVSLDDIPF